MNAMNEDEIKNVILGILKQIAPESDPSTLAPEENIRKTLDIDSFDALTFFVRIDEKIGVSVPESDYGKLNTITEMLEYFSCRMS